MTTDKDPDFAGIAKQLAEAYRTEQIMKGDGRCYEQAQGYASCMEARLRSDWETIRLLKRLPHAQNCLQGVPKLVDDGHIGSWDKHSCTCGLSAHLSKLIQPFTP